MNLDHSSLSTELQVEKRYSRWFWFSVFVALLFAGSEAIALLLRGNKDLIWSTLPIFAVTPFTVWLALAGRRTLGAMLFITAIGIQCVLAPMYQSGMAIQNAIVSDILIVSIGFSSFPRKYISSVLIFGLCALLAVILIDSLGDAARPAAGLSEGRWLFAILVSIAFSFFIYGEFLALNIRAKIVLGILFTGGAALSILVFFAIHQAQEITNVLSIRLDASVRQLAEVQLINAARLEAERANQQFDEVIVNVTGLAQNWSALRAKNEALGAGPYWDARTSLLQLEGGQYGNSGTDTSSVFVPVGTIMDDSLFVDVNTSAYLDFYAPGILESQPALLAIYSIDTRGITRYYPNINLASVLPPDFDATQRPYYSITAPQANPERLPRWSVPYVDATGGGLVVTVAAPVYSSNQFIGIIAADMKLNTLAQQVNSMRVGETGYAFMIDNEGHSIAMPQAGLNMFDIRPEDAESEDLSKRTVSGHGNEELDSVISRMTEGGSGLAIVNIDGREMYISFSPILTNGYSIALVVPVSELQGAIVSAQQETSQQIQSAGKLAVVILIVLLAFAVAVSLGLGQIIAAPIQQLTQVATQIASGDLSVQAIATNEDETGTLGRAFNTMTARLRSTLDGLERMVADRTAELLSANEKNERRAKQFESIAKVARTVSSTRELDLLLAQITSVISREFGFYHVGIFLLDSAKQFAVLSAANSEGGKLLLESSHRLKVGEYSIVGTVTQTGRPRVASDTETDSTYFKNPNLPTTRSEIALPLRMGDEVIGALDVQSTEPDVFSSEDIHILSTLADQVSIAIQNAQQFEQTRKALKEAEELAKQFVQTGWQQFARNENLVGVRHTGARSILLHPKDIKSKDEDPASSTPRGTSISLPIKLRGEVIGLVDVRTPDNRPWDPDELDIATAIIERAAITMENARLLQESQRLASKEAKIGEVTAKISASINMRNVLQTAVEELGRALPGSEVVIQFQTDKKNGKNSSPEPETGHV